MFPFISGQRKTEECEFRFWPREKWNESDKIRGPFFLFFSFSARSLTLAFLVLCSETARKRLLSRLFEKRAVFSVGLVNSLREPLFQNVKTLKLLTLFTENRLERLKLGCSNADLTNYVEGPEWGGGEIPF